MASRLVLAVALAAAVSLVALVAGGQARLPTGKHCGVWGDPLLRYDVVVVRGSVSCTRARTVMRRWGSTQRAATGWKCKGAVYNADDECRHGRTVVRDYYRLPPSSAKPACADVQDGTGLRTATNYTVVGLTCGTAQAVATTFMAEPSCAFNLQSKTDFECVVTPPGRTTEFLCRGEIQTVKQIYVECPILTNQDNGVNFYVES